MDPEVNPAVNEQASLALLNASTSIPQYGS
jgi:hypothetical protein